MDIESKKNRITGLTSKSYIKKPSSTGKEAITGLTYKRGSVTSKLGKKVVTKLKVRS